MSKGPVHFITFRSNLFSMAKRDDYINPCCFCEPLAQWLEERLSAALPTMASGIYQEDFGWVNLLQPQGEAYVIMVVAQTFLTYEDETSDEFGIYIWGRPPGLLRRLMSRTSLTSTLPTNRNLVVQAIDSVLHAEAGIRQIEWWREGFLTGESSPHPAL